MVLKPEKEAEAKAIFDKWDLDFAIVGETIAEDRFLIIHNETVKADLPLSKLASTAPEYDRPWIETTGRTACRHAPDRSDRRLTALITSPNYARKHWVWEQYDSQVMADTVQARPWRGHRPGARYGKDAGLHVRRNPSLCQSKSC